MSEQHSEKIFSQIDITKVSLGEETQAQYNDKFGSSLLTQFGYKMILAQQNDRGTWKQLISNLGSSHITIFQCKGLYL